MSASKDRRRVTDDDPYGLRDVRPYPLISQEQAEDLPRMLEVSL